MAQSLPEQYSLNVHLFILVVNYFCVCSGLFFLVFCFFLLHFLLQLSLQVRNSLSK